MNKNDQNYVPALRFRWLTRYYDLVVAVTTRESVFRNKVLGLVPVNGIHKVLDLACGTGTLTCLIKQTHPTVTIHGLDGDSEILEQARKKSLDQGLKISFERGLSDSLPYPDDSFDLVISSLFFHHLSMANKQNALGELRRVLPVGGKLLICDWGKPANPLLRLMFLLVQMLDGFEVTRDNVRGGLPAMIAAAGFGQVTIKERVSNMLGTLDLITAINT